MKKVTTGGIVAFLTMIGLLSAPFAPAAADALATYQPPAKQARAEIKWVKPICIEKDRYIGWPTVCRLANGDVMAVFSGDRDDHVCPFGKVQMVKSSDEGKTWSEPVTIANGPIDDRDAGIVQLPDGEIFVTYFTSVAYRAPNVLARHVDYKRHDDALSDEVRNAALGNWAVRSRDNGKTWTKPEKLSMRGQTPHGPILLKDGSLLQFGRFFSDPCTVPAMIAAAPSSPQNARPMVAAHGRCCVPTSPPQAASIRKDISSTSRMWWNSPTERLSAWCATTVPTTACG